MSQLNSSLITDTAFDVDYAVSQDMEAAPGAIRWNNGVLQQEWVTQQYLASGARRKISVWRDVPAVDDEKDQTNDQ